jgi:hypothetical protein
MLKRLTLLLCFLLIHGILLAAMDFGLILEQNLDYGGFGNRGSVAYSGIAIPRFSALIGDNSDISISLGLEATFNEDWHFIPELLRTELSLYGGIFDFTAGRMRYSDPLGFIANGLFDGMQLSLTGEAGVFRFGAWYTGFLYKRRANIAMTAAELQSYSAAVDFNDFQNTYFAPSRIIWALGCEYLGGPALAYLSVFGQIDLSEGFNFARGRLLHSQYIAGKVSLPGNLFAFNLGACLGLSQYGGEFALSHAAELGISFMPPLNIPSRFSFLARNSSGVSETGQFTAFRPITTTTQGEILNARLSGLLLFSLDYMARIHRNFAFGITSTYFMRNDLGTYSSYPVLGDSDGHFLGNEFFARLIWTPASDLQFNLRGGVFLPSLGNVTPDAESAWRVELNVVISLR